MTAAGVTAAAAAAAAGLAGVQMDHGPFGAVAKEAWRGFKWTMVRLELWLKTATTARPRSRATQ